MTNIAWTVPLSATSFHDLKQSSRPIPTAGPGEVLVRLTAVALNHRDLHVSSRPLIYPGRDGRGGDHIADLVPVCDGAGVIDSTGPSSRWAGREGTKVILHPNNWLSGDVQNLDIGTMYGAADSNGLLQQYITISDDRVIEAPKQLSASESASLLGAGCTAWAAIREALDGSFDGRLDSWQDGKRLQGKTILTQGTGGVTCFTIQVRAAYKNPSDQYADERIQIAAALGATVVVTSSSDNKLKLAKEIGATHGINYIKTPEWEKEVLRLTNSQGVDHVIELCGASTLLQSVNSARNGGLISVIGILSEHKDIDAGIVSKILQGGKIVKGVVMFSRDHTAEFARFVEKHQIKPIIAKEFEFQNARDALQALKDQTEVGKIVIKISDE
ncbi:isoleucine-tRNA ligase [Curvularia kusanoi]|uniref:Isoleucine-tRNA ligase n=1 Tax=Curvularia kusanoi TaxID=90978 RepID=A0A9P4TAD0_CURKU|nr:isoleucine-tRNA ligase [Curvularia kusanoi]